LLRVLNQALNHLEEWLIATLIAAATGLIFIAVVHRYGAGESIVLSRWAAAHGMNWLATLSMAVFTFLSELDLSWAQELCIYMFIWMAKFGAAYGVRTGIHVGVDVLVNQLSPQWRKSVVLFSLLCGALFTVVVGTMGLKFVMELYATDQVTADLEAPRWIVFSAVPAGSYLMCFRFLQVAFAFWKTGALPHHDESRVEGIEIDAPPEPQPSSPAGAAR